MRWVPLCGAWGLWCECPYEVSGVYLEISFLKVMGFMRRVPLRGLWGLSGEHLLWALWPFWGLWTLWYGVDTGSAFMMWNGLSTRVLLCGENLYEVFGFYEVSSFKGFMAFMRKSIFMIFIGFMRRVPVWVLWGLWGYIFMETHIYEVDEF